MENRVDQSSKEMLIEQVTSLQNLTMTPDLDDDNEKDKDLQDIKKKRI